MQRTITLTGAQPVRINEDAWPVIASARAWDGRHEQDSFRRGSMFVRRHREDGRLLIYAVYTTQWEGESDWRGGSIHPQGADPVSVVEALADSMPQFGATLARECVQDLPSVPADAAAPPESMEERVARLEQQVARLKARLDRQMNFYSV